MAANCVMWVLGVVYDYNGNMDWDMRCESVNTFANVSRCILKIIPTIVIYNTPELESWIENKY